MLVKEVIDFLETIAPPAFQESYDNAGLQVGDPGQEATAALICIDVTEEVLEEAIRKKANLIIAHHPVIFGGIKKLTGSHFPERILIRAIQGGLAVYAAHTNLDAADGGVSDRLAKRIGLEKTRVLAPLKDQLGKLVFFVPPDKADKVRQEIFNAGAGRIGEYDMCSFSTSGEGTFRGSDNTDPYVGERGKLHTEPELRIETIFPRYLEKGILRALLEAHPYEKAGMGVIGNLPAAMKEKDFLDMLKERCGPGMIRHSKLLGKPVRIIAVCGGSGSFLTERAISSGADVFITADLKYHQFFEADGRLLMADIGHYESEQFTKEIFYENLIKKFPTFALHLSEQNTNPVNYF